MASNAPLAKAPAKQLTPKDKVLFMLEQSEAAITAALPKHLTPERMMRVARTAIQTTPDLFDCTPHSVIGSVVEAAQIGLEVNSPLEQAHLIPFKNRRTGRRECQLIVGYRGLIDLARRSGDVQSISAHVVYSGDEFDYEYGLDEKLVHKPSMPRQGEPVAAYAVCRFKSGGHHFEVMSAEEINKIRDDVYNWERGAWKSNWDQMARKTAIRRISNYIPRSSELAMASQLTDRRDVAQPIVADNTSYDWVQEASLEDRLNVVDDAEVIDADTGEVIADPRMEPEPGSDRAERLKRPTRQGNWQATITTLDEKHGPDIDDVYISALDEMECVSLEKVPSEKRKEFAALVEKGMGA